MKKILKDTLGHIGDHLTRRMIRKYLLRVVSEERKVDVSEPSVEVDVNAFSESSRKGNESHVIRWHQTVQTHCSVTFVTESWTGHPFP
jgi:acyl-CoA hydrolase